MKVAQVGSEKVVDDKGIRMLNLDEDFGKLRVWEAVNSADNLKACNVLKKVFAGEHW